MDIETKTTELSHIVIDDTVDLYIRKRGTHYTIAANRINNSTIEIGFTFIDSVEELF